MSTLNGNRYLHVSSPYLRKRLDIPVNEPSNESFVKALKKVEIIFHAETTHDESRALLQEVTELLGRDEELKIS